MNKKALIAVVLLVVVVAGAAWWLTRSTTSTNNTNAGTQSTQSPQPAAQEDGSSAEQVTITYSDSGYSPQSVTVKSGDTVVIKNESSRSMQFESDPHPAHTNNTELNAGSVPPGQSMSFMVNRVGTFGYHNHLNASQKGTIVVE